MTGNFNIQLVQNKTNPKDKWIVWKRNIGEKYFCSIINFKENDIMEEINNLRKYLGLGPNPIDTLSKDQTQRREQDRFGNSLILSTDLLRPFTMREYILLSAYLKKYGYIYNKQKDEFIKKET